MTFKEASEEFLDYIKITRSNGTYRVYKGKVKVLAKFFKNYNIEDITKKDMIKFWKWRQDTYQGITPQTLNKYRTVLILMVEYHTDKRLNIAKLKENRKLTEIIHEEILFKVLTHLQIQEGYKEALRNLVLFKLLLDTGLRINETLNLKVSDFIFPDNTIHVKITKTKTERFVYFNDDTKRLLKRIITRDQTSGYIFKSYKSQGRLSVDNVQNICYRIEKRLQLPYNIRPHKWRHTFATRFLKRGGDLETLRLILGHSSIKTTQRYLHLDNDFIKQQYFTIMQKH